MLRRIQIATTVNWSPTAEIRAYTFGFDATTGCAGAVVQTATANAPSHSCRTLFMRAILSSGNCIHVGIAGIDG